MAAGVSTLAFFIVMLYGKNMLFLNKIKPLAYGKVI